MPRESYNRRNEPKERDKSARVKRGHALNNDSVTKACDAWQKRRDGITIEQPPEQEAKLEIIKTNGKARAAHYPTPSMRDVIAASRVAYLANRRKKTQ
jgi:hypothetical protein